MSNFEEIIFENGMNMSAVQPRVLERRASTADDLETMEAELQTAFDYEKTDPAMAEEYLAFVFRSWREFGYKKKQITRLNAQALANLRLDEEY
jgi:hypothetical protein